MKHNAVFCSLLYLAASFSAHLGWLVQMRRQSLLRQIHRLPRRRR